MMGSPILFLKNRIILSVVLLFLFLLPISVYAQNATAFNATKLLSSGNPLAPSPAYAAVYSALVTSVLLLAITVFIYGVIKISGKRTASPTHTGTFSDIIRTKDGYLSLSYLQLLIWTYVISFTFVFIYFFRIFWGEYTIYAGVFPENLLGLLGISAGATVSSRMIGEKSLESNNVQQKLDADKENAQSDVKDRELHTLFYGGKQQFSLSKFQMFLWTIMSVTIYIVLFLVVVNNAVIQMDSKNTSPEQKLDLLRHLSIPDVDSVMLVLMGISQGSYLGVKLSDKKSDKSSG